MKISEALFAGSSTRISEKPKQKFPEFAFIGRSNVGKSSLINMLCRNKKLAMTSSKPGKTRLVNHFLINREWYLVDLPGYGYAKMSATGKQKLEQVIRNYLSNALNHLEGENVIDIRAVLNEEKGTARISVFNTGKPIPKEDIDQIWNKFYKVDKARTREYGGNGIGLSIVKAIMDSFQKEYGVKNYSNGVEFWFELDVR